MTTKRFGRLVLLLAAIGTLPLAAFADEIVIGKAKNKRQGN